MPGEQRGQLAGTSGKGILELRLEVIMKKHATGYLHWLDARTTEDSKVPGPGEPRNRDGGRGGGTHWRTADDAATAEEELILVQ